MTKLIVGLGNPGKDYENTRHNIGFMVLDSFTKKRNIDFNKEKFNGLYAEENVNQEKIIYLKPLKYMNLSGEVVVSFINYYKIAKKDILIINDDLNLPLGKIRLRAQGSSGGHNGLKNIEMHLGTDTYKRLRIGIGSNVQKNMKDFVLGKFNKEDMKILEEAFKITDEILSLYLKEDFDILMNKYN